MRALKQPWHLLTAVLAALALFTPATPDVLALWHGGHDHEHGHGAGGWVHRSTDHARHDASQLEPADPVQRAECAACAIRTRSADPLLLTPESAARPASSGPVALAAAHPVASRALAHSRPRAPPVV